MNDFEVFVYSVHNSLGIGHDNALTRKELCVKLKCGDRTLRRAIEVLRHSYPILSRDDGRGYYIPETTEEGRNDALRWLSRQDSRVKSIKISEAGAAKFAKNKNKKEFPGQLLLSFRDDGL